ncbi:MAG: hypothetical protein Q7S74_01240 [Nanoarchaeota archaeon]|nr:hypothetical protein [Nanoarchaeota archaeon]
MENQESTKYLQPTFTERNVKRTSNMSIALFLGVIIIFVFVITIIATAISLITAMALFALFALLYGIALTSLLEPLKIREINHTTVRTIEKPIVKEVFVDRPLIKEVVVEKPVYRDVVRNVYVSSKSPIKIPRYNYLVSLQTKRYHSRSCRLGKLIKRKYKISNNSKSYFIKKKFKACKVCIIKKK